MKKIVLVLGIVGFQFLQPAYAYIDPGTGSMLFSVLLCIITTIFFLIQTLWMKIKTLFTDRSLSKEKTSFVIYSEGKKYDNVFLPILDEFEKREVPVVFYTSSQDDLVFEKNYKFVKSQFIGQGNKAFLKLAFLKADVCLMTTPHLDVFQLKRSKDVQHYCHIPHAIGDFCGYKLFGVDYYDSVLITTEHNIPQIREIEQKRELPEKELVVVGSPQLDFMKEHIKEVIPLPKEKFTVLFSPSWGESSVLARFGDKILEQLSKKNDWEIIFRPHPQSYTADKKLLDYLFEKYKNAENITVDKSYDNIPSMLKADIMISDFSGIVYEYTFLFNKPVLYSLQNANLEIYDISTLGRKTWKDEAIKKIGTELTSENIDDLINVIQNTSGDKQANIQEIKDFAWQKQGEGAKNTVDFLIKKQEILSNKC